MTRVIGFAGAGVKLRRTHFARVIDAPKDRRPGPKAHGVTGGDTHPRHEIFRRSPCCPQDLLDSLGGSAHPEEQAFRRGREPEL